MYPEQNGELPAIATPEAAARQHVEEIMSPAAPEQRNAPGARMPADPATAATPVAPQAAPPMASADEPATAPASQVAGAPAIADDVDLIEKEWVDKAKQIIERTGNEPFEQKQEMDRLKADYLQKRYNKVVKADNPA